MKAIGGLLFGILLGCTFQVAADEKICAVVIFAAADSMCGGLTAKLNSNFSDAALIGGFLTNLIFALILIWAGNLFKLEVVYIALLIFGLRIFENLSTAREIFLKSYRK